MPSQAEWFHIIVNAPAGITVQQDENGWNWSAWAPTGESESFRGYGLADREDAIRVAVQVLRTWEMLHLAEAARPPLRYGPQIDADREEYPASAEEVAHSLAKTTKQT